MKEKICYNPDSDLNYRHYVELLRRELFANLGEQDKLFVETMHQHRKECNPCNASIESEVRFLKNYDLVDDILEQNIKELKRSKF